MQSLADDNQYLVTEVFTAPPQKLQLMLIEAAIRLIGRARQQWQARENGQACQSLLQVQEIIDELIAAMNRDACPDLVDQVAAVYEFVARRLREAAADRDDDKLQDVLRVLEIERETWRQVCAQLSGQGYSQEQFQPSVEPGLPALGPGRRAAALDLASEIPLGGFSVEA